jgi:hypothetical protein
LKAETVYSTTEQELHEDPYLKAYIEKLGWMIYFLPKKIPNYSFTFDKKNDDRFYSLDVGNGNGFEEALLDIKKRAALSEHYEIRLSTLLELALANGIRNLTVINEACSVVSNFERDRYLTPSDPDDNYIIRQIHKQMNDKSTLVREGNFQYFVSELNETKKVKARQKQARLEKSRAKWGIVSKGAAEERGGTRRKKYVRRYKSKKLKKSKKNKKNKNKKTKKHSFGKTL